MQAYIFILLATIVFFILTLIWRNSDLGNLTIRISFGLLTFFGGYIIFTQEILSHVFFAG